MEYPDNIQVKTVREVSDWVTNVDRPDLRENYALRLRGVLLKRAGVICERDWGTKERYANYPTALASHVAGYLLYIPADVKEYLVLVGLDSASNMRIFVDDGTGAGNWTELSRKLSASINDAAIAATDTTITIHSLQDILAANVAASADELQNYIVVNQTGARAGEAILLTANTSVAADGSDFTITNDVYLGSSGLNWQNSDSLLIYRTTGIYDGYNFSNGATPHIRWLEINEQKKVNLMYGTSADPPVMRNPIQIRKAKYARPESFAIGGTPDTGWVDMGQPFGASTVVNGLSAGYLFVFGATNLSPIEIDVGTAHGLSTGATVFIAGVGGNTAANGSWVITSTGANTFTLDGSTGNGAWTSGGFVIRLIGVSEDGHIRRSVDGSATWTDEQSITGGSFGGVKMYDWNNGYAVGWDGTYCKVYNTTDGGDTWSDVSPTTLAVHMTAIAVTAANTVFIGGPSATIYKTTDSGSSWALANTNIAVLSPDFETLVFSFPSATVGFAAGSYPSPTSLRPYPMWKTTDAGATWTQLTIVGSGFSIYGMTFASTTVGWYANNFGIIWNTADGGTTWTSQYYTGAVIPFRALGYASTTDVYVVGDRYGGQYGRILNTDNGGTTWDEEQSPGVDASLKTITMIGTRVSFAGGTSGRVIRIVAAASGTAATGAGDGWYIDKAQLNPNYTAVGAATDPKYSSDTTTVYNVELGEGVRAHFSFSTDTSDSQFHARIYLVELYGGADGLVYQRTDPIFQLFVSAASAGFPRVPFRIDVDLAKINKNVVGFELYEDIRADSDIASDLGNWIDEAKGYILMKRVLFSDDGWQIDRTTAYTRQFSVDLNLALHSETSSTNASSTLLSILGHDVSKTRQYYSPRYAVKAARTQDSTVAIDIDDKTALLSCYSGAGAHMDDAFVDITVDALGRQQKVGLIGRGDLLGFAILNDNLVELRPAEVVPHDLQSGIQRIIPADVYARNSLTSIGAPDAPGGLAWAGRNALYIMSPDFVIKAINPNWQNFYNGDLMTTTRGTPFLTDANRKTIVGTYNLERDELWFQMLCGTEDGSTTEYLVARTNFKKWYPRKFNITGNAIAYFTTARDGTLLIGSATKALRYPNRDWNTVDVSGAADNGVGLIRITTSAVHGLTTGDKVFIEDVLGVTAANGEWTVTVVDTTNIDLDGSTFAGTYTSGGTVVISHPYEDEVSYLGISASKGIDTIVHVVFGSLFGLSKQILAYSIIQEHSGTVGHNGVINIDFYGNGYATAFQTMPFRPDQPFPVRGIPPRGQLSRMEAKYSIPTADLVDCRDFVLSQIEIGFLTEERIGD